MGSRGDFAKKQAKKPKKGNAPSAPTFSTKPVFEMPKVISKDRKSE